MQFISLKDLREKELVPGFKVRFVHSDNMTLAYWTIKGNSSLPGHSHLHEQVVNIIEGEFELTIDGEVRILKGGEVAVIPPHVTHSGRSVTDCSIIDVFYPIREDYL
ncbi:cupin domain-containing protein [Desulfonema magnum]|uniref:Cupin domain-containing protein n=1 Tax=Desulfonema magnum TaxID=45655 RepID=A0A975BQW1_9BACT|nr:cupin domain-containing protein [Desulfonema magnum]QTA89733.1 Cupin domain-containing protein [Desulfonema magnum]